MDDAPPYQPSDTFCELCLRPYKDDGWGKQSATFGFACHRCVNKACRVVRRHNRRARKAGCVGRLYAFQWLSILFGSTFRCGTCKERTHLTLDHIIPLRDGGMNLAHNIQALCLCCHGLKDNIPSGTKRSGYFCG
jgi:5-methylcytosine-specific restriction endonuclease McrA